jgi:DNA polymerase elongation subunit (family B)
LAQAGRVYLENDSINRVYTEDPETLSRYNLDDVRETLAVSRLLSQPYFLQTRMFPYSYQNCIVRGNATRINSLFLREYLRRGASVPRSGKESSSFEGGYTDVFIHGVVGPVVHCDVASLYPSLLLAYQLKPARDELDLFLPLLAVLRQFRLESKKHAWEEEDGARREYFTALQQAFKVLINSFYGYLGSPLHNFSDPETAAGVTRLGRDTIRAMIEWLHDRKARAVEIDTDGIYFIPPPGVETREQEEVLIRELSASLRQGLDVELDGRYRAMFSYKSKNYALLGYDGSVLVKGSALRSRGVERYIREFMTDVIRLLLNGEAAKIEPLYRHYLERLREYRFDIGWLSKTETLGESPATYTQKVRQGKKNRSAAYEIALQSSHAFRAGDQITYYISGRGKGVVSYENCRPVSSYDPDRPDVNLEFYEEKLRQAKKKFAAFSEPDNPLFSWNSGEQGL